MKAFCIPRYAPVNSCVGLPYADDSKSSDTVPPRPIGQRAAHGLLPGPEFLVLIIYVSLSACGLSSQQRSSVIEFGHSLNNQGQLLAEEATFIRSEVKLTSVTMVSLPYTESSALFNEGSFQDLGLGVPESRIQKLVQMGGAASDFGDSLAQVADVTSSTAREKIFSAKMREFVQVVGAVTEATSNVSLGAPVVNLVSYVSTEAYRKRYLRHALPAAEPAIRAAHKDIDGNFDPDNPQSLLAVFAAATGRLAGMLQASERSPKVANLSAENREIVANAYRIVARNRDHIRYVTSRESELADKGASAYDALISAFNGDESKLATVDSYSVAVSEVRLAFESLK
jgi:hypothetical protein